MAFLKEIQTDFGVPACYWNIGETLFDYFKRRCQVKMYGFASAEARQSGKQPMAAMNIVIEQQDFPSDESRATIYEKVKLLPDWADAQSDEV